MNEQTLLVLGGGVALIPAGWAAWQLWNAIFSKFARKEDLTTLRKDHDDLEQSIHKLKSSVPSISMWNTKNEATDKLLEDRRKGEVALHDKIDAKSDKLNQKIDDLGKEMTRGFSDIKDLLIKR